MSEFRDLQAKLQQIEESYFSDLDLELQEFRRANKDLPADKLVALVRGRFGQEAATHVSNQIESEADLADYEASDPQPHMNEGGDELFVNDEQHAQITAALAKKDPELTISGYGPGDNGTINVLVSTGNFNVDDPYDAGDRHFVFDPAYGDFIDNDGFNDWIDQNPFESIDEEDEIKGVNDKYDDETLNCKHCGDYFCTSKFGGECPGIQRDLFDEESEITYLKHPEGYEPKPLPPRHKLDSMDWMHVQDDVIQMMKSFEHKMKSQNVWDKGVELAGGEDQLWKVMQWRAEEVMEDYRGSGEGIGTSDMNHFVRGVFSDIGEDDIWGWNKPKVEEDMLDPDDNPFGNEYGWSDAAEELKDIKADYDNDPQHDEIGAIGARMRKVSGIASDEDMERLKTGRYAKYNKAIRNEGEEDEIESFADRVKRYGKESDDIIKDSDRRRQARKYGVSGPSRGRRSYGRGTGKALGTLGMTESFSDWIEDFTARPDDREHRYDHDPSYSNEVPISQQVKSLLAQGKKVMSKVGGAVGEITRTDGRLLYIKFPGRRESVTSFDSKDNMEIIGGIDHYDVVHHYKEDLDEARGRVVEVPLELRGTDASNEAGATSRDAERFLADLGPDDDVSHDVVDPETGELLDWPTKEILKKQDDEEMDQYWRSQGGTKRERGQAKYKADQAGESFDDVPNLILYSGTSFGSDTDHAHEFIQDLRNSDFYNIVWNNVSDEVDDPDYFMDRDYDVDVEVPAALKRKDGKKLTGDDHDNIKEIIKAVKAASTMGNLGLGYAGTSEEGTTARFYPSFM